MTEVDASRGFATPPKPPDPVMKAARALEGAFLSEMLKSTGFGEARQAFGGGAGEDQFASMLRDTQANAIADAGGIGLAEAIYRAMTRDGVGHGA
ncbi:MAG: rod-binding protein [Pseudomonadota bacterium]